ncbi:MAG: S1 RNA-binding domain-containing protein [Oscillospiraceae bacterium]|nr:S1 RNA-binding domain-containing protein [Oscillospiraceae bacterium]
MELEVGSILDGKVTGITKFGAFVALPGGRSGLVHISEIAYTYVSDVNELLSVGQEVKVKLIGIDDNGRINLSIKKTAPPPARPAGPRPQGARPAPAAGRPAPSHSGQGGSFNRTPGKDRGPAREREPQSFDDMVKHFLSESESRQSDLNRGGESRRPRRSRRG